MESKTSKEIIDDLQKQLAQERLKNRTLTEELKQLKDSHARIQIVTENEEEYITNKFMKYLNQLKREKEELALKVEQEEEYLTNTLQKKMQVIMQEKIDLENQLEQEEEFIVNKLQKQIQEVMREKKLLEKRLESEISDHRNLLKLEAEVITLRTKIQELEKEQGDHNKDDIASLRAENFVLGQKIIREQEKLSKLTSDNTKLMSNLEIDDERNFNKQKRNRSISFPNERSATGQSVTGNNGSNQSSPVTSHVNSSSSITLSPTQSSSSITSSGSTSKTNIISVPITRSRSSSSCSNPCLISKVLKEGWMKRNLSSESSCNNNNNNNNNSLENIGSPRLEIKLEKRYYEVSSDGELREYLDDSKQALYSSLNLDTVTKAIDKIDPAIGSGYSDLIITTTTDVIILSNYTDEVLQWKKIISDLMP
ncbi:hypothetical protein CYY_004116 [Polysphondylium violaceum]|uniref:Uncharacterized protein n=1 Tax=Polysphondylium violaceum TaxID=133409 RepID=A0A8J4PWP0_9MYCE|nr:hypothetical protein CYY_004116 [Polysphondylium violaceum]